MSEKAMRRRVLSILKPLHARPIENLCESGTPDVTYAHGWIELKKLPKWPKRPSTIVKIEHFTDDQRDWLRGHTEAGGNAWLLVQIAQDWLIFDGRTAAEKVGLVNRKETEFYAVEMWNRRNPVNPGLREFLKNAKP